MLSEVVKTYEIAAIYQPVVNGVGGNLVAIFASRLSTRLHKFPKSLGSWVSWAPRKFWLFPYETYFGRLSMNIQFNLFFID